MASNTIEYQCNTYYPIGQKSKEESNLWDGKFHEFVYITVGNKDILYRWSSGYHGSEGNNGYWYLNSDGSLVFNDYDGDYYDACFSQVAALSHES